MSELSKEDKAALEAEGLSTKQGTTPKETTPPTKEKEE
jgi:hypothetical protein